MIATFRIDLYSPAGPEFRQGESQTEEIGEYQKYRSLLWTAPELLSQEEERPWYGSQKGDVYSYGIILQEIIFRALPYFTEDTTPQGMVASHASKLTVSSTLVLILIQLYFLSLVHISCT